MLKYSLKDCKRKNEIIKELHKNGSAKGEQQVTEEGPRKGGSAESKEKLRSFGKGIVKEIEGWRTRPSRPWPGAAPT